MRNGLFVLTLLAALVASTLAGAGTSSASEPGVDPESVFDFLPTELTILSPDDEVVIGRGRYTVADADGMILVEGVNEYLDGRRDRELERLTPGPPGEAPILVSAEHAFFNADGSPRVVDRLDARSGDASCTEYERDGVEKVHRSTLAVPRDTYAGATQLMLVVSRLRQGRRERIKLHSFNCMPGPKIVPIHVSVAAERTRWRMYPGDLAKTEIEPDLGWIGILIAPFIGKMEVWFDPADRWNYVGARFDRFYKGEHILTVRTR
jgi:hypothetical protein